jgi:hypothetical protein
MSPFTSPESSGFWNTSGMVQQAALAAGGAWNAVYFARRAVWSRGGLRLAAGVLCGVFAGIALQAASALGGSEGAEVALRTPLLAAVLATTAVVSTRSRR